MHLRRMTIRDLARYGEDRYSMLWLAERRQVAEPKELFEALRGLSADVRSTLIAEVKHPALGDTARQIMMLALSGCAIRGIAERLQRSTASIRSTVRGATKCVWSWLDRHERPEELLSRRARRGLNSWFDLHGKMEWTGPEVQRELQKYICTHGKRSLHRFYGWGPRTIDEVIAWAAVNPREEDVDRYGGPLDRPDGAESQKENSADDPWRGRREEMQREFEEFDQNVRAKEGVLKLWADSEKWDFDEMLVAMREWCVLWHRSRATERERKCVEAIVGERKRVLSWFWRRSFCRWNNEWMLCYEVRRLWWADPFCWMRPKADRWPHQFRWQFMQQLSSVGLRWSERKLAKFALPRVSGDKRRNVTPRDSVRILSVILPREQQNRPSELWQPSLVLTAHCREGDPTWLTSLEKARAKSRAGYSR